MRSKIKPNGSWGKAVVFNMAAWNEKEVEALIDVFSEETIHFQYRKSKVPKG